MKDYGKVRTFRMFKNDENQLNKCFEMLDVKGDNFTEKMRCFITYSYDELRENERQIDKLHKRIDEQATQIKELESKVKEGPKPSVLEGKEFEETFLGTSNKVEPTKPSKPQPTKTEARPPTKPLSKPLIVKDQVEQPKEIEKPKSTDELLNRICLKHLRVFGVGRQIACRNCKKRDPSQYAACLEIQREQLGLS